MKILVADDDTTFRLVLAGTLKKLGHEVVAVKDGLDAWNAHLKDYYSVIITDWKMPRLEGMVLTMMIRARPHPAYTYVIMLTAHGSKESYMDGIKAGADDFLIKPFDEDQLAARLMVAERIVGVRNHVKQLERVIPICSYCKKARDENDQWVDMEHYVEAHAREKLSHTVCPICYQEHLKPELERLGIHPDESKIR